MGAREPLRRRRDTPTNYPAIQNCFKFVVGAHKGPADKGLSFTEAPY